MSPYLSKRKRSSPSPDVAGSSFPKRLRISASPDAVESPASKRPRASASPAAMESLASKRLQTSASPAAVNRSLSSQTRTSPVPELPTISPTILNTSSLVPARASPDPPTHALASSDTIASLPPQASLLGLPRELRDLIYEQVYSGEQEEGSKNLRLLLTCQQVHSESAVLAFSKTKFHFDKFLGRLSSKRDFLESGYFLGLSSISSINQLELSSPDLYRNVTSLAFTAEVLYVDDDEACGFFRNALGFPPLHQVPFKTLTLHLKENCTGAPVDFFNCNRLMEDLWDVLVYHDHLRKIVLDFLPDPSLPLIDALPRETGGTWTYQQVLVNDLESYLHEEAAIYHEIRGHPAATYDEYPGRAITCGNTVSFKIYELYEVDDERTKDMTMVFKPMRTTR
ncbi:hypothetical protein K402DRAFT_451632 [Aulographum hederae CBS 113979]|uniref:F-box domain-containing protein n=1 Tax=Aulographum hederae CBS 113979 TaxID=1176131 RepID=A0A6G1HAF3_9PEZI|nr:hypothetical protein K402DRAFT_451632 [Aulographum hederae CBS 113979]